MLCALVYGEFDGKKRGGGGDLLVYPDISSMFTENSVVWRASASGCVPRVGGEGGVAAQRIYSAARGYFKDSRTPLRCRSPSGAMSALYLLLTRI